MDDKVNMSDERLGDMMLDCAGLTKNEKLMILTSTGNSKKQDKIEEALKEQHAKVHYAERREGKDGAAVPRRQGGKGKGRYRKPFNRFRGQANVATGDQFDSEYADGEEEEWDDEDYKWWKYDKLDDDDYKSKHKSRDDYHKPKSNNKWEEWNEDWKHSDWPYHETDRTEPNTVRSSSSTEPHYD